MILEIEKIFFQSIASCHVHSSCWLIAPAAFSAKTMALVLRQDAKIKDFAKEKSWLSHLEEDLRKTLFQSPS